MAPRRAQPRRQPAGRCVAVLQAPALRRVYWSRRRLRPSAPIGRVDLRRSGPPARSALAPGRAGSTERRDQPRLASSSSAPRQARLPDRRQPRQLGRDWKIAGRRASPDGGPSASWSSGAMLSGTYPGRAPCPQRTDLHDVAGLSVCSAVLVPLTNTPLRLPRSRTTTRSSAVTNSACRRDSSEWSWLMSHVGSRPTTIRPTSCSSRSRVPSLTTSFLLTV